MVKNLNFSFKENTSIVLELPFSEHIEELRQRLIILFTTILCLTTCSFLKVKNIVKILEYPINNVKFFQISPGEYFISTVKISFYTGLLFTGPFIMSQIILFLLPGLTKKEIKIILPLLISSLILFGLGVTFSYYTLIPAALNFFLNYSEEVIEPFWSFDQYFEFILVLFYTTGLAFQIPIIQINWFIEYCVNFSNVKCMAIYNSNFNNFGSYSNTIYRSINTNIISISYNVIIFHWIRYLVFNKTLIYILGHISF